MIFVRVIVCFDVEVFDDVSAKFNKGFSVDLRETFVLVIERHLGLGKASISAGSI